MGIISKLPSFRKLFFTRVKKQVSVSQRQSKRSCSFVNPTSSLRCYKVFSWASIVLQVIPAAGTSNPLQGSHLQVTFHVTHEGNDSLLQDHSHFTFPQNRASISLVGLHPQVISLPSSPLTVPSLPLMFSQLYGSLIQYSSLLVFS